MRETRPSATALLIARAMAFLSRDPALAPLIPRDTADVWRRLLGAAAPHELARADFFGARPWGRWLFYRGERFAIPGVMLHYAVRKRYLEDTARRVLRGGGAGGAAQLIVLGAGLDTLALRLSGELPDVLFVECDHPATQAVKRRALVESGLASNLHLVELDLGRRTLEETLLAVPGFRPGADTLLIAEGLTMYLQAEAVDGLFAFLRRHAGPGSRFAFTFMEPQENGKVDFPGSSPFVRPWLRMVGEPFTWGVRRRDLPGFLAERGFALEELATPDLFRERYLSPPEAAGLVRRRLAEGEYVCVARRSA